jgi:uncharacterized metal-binding protein
MPTRNKHFPIVYACSGCSSAAQLANHVALQLDRRGIAEMSCISGIGGDVPSLVKLAKSGRTVVALDGCPLSCARQCLARHGVKPNHYHQLSEYGVKKKYHIDFDLEQAEEIFQRVALSLQPKAAPPSHI